MKDGRKRQQQSNACDNDIVLHNNTDQAMPQTTFTFRVDEDLKNHFKASAKALDCTGAQLLRDFMRDFVHSQQNSENEHDAWLRREVQIGLDSANAGRLVPNEAVEIDFATRRAETRRKLNNR